jgi:hypothetical protein
MPAQEKIDDCQQPYPQNNAATLRICA